ncbi:MAG: AmmeMemoRadiSam system protein A [Candidatus Nitrohelix vancouverensis]|uniref:AmmeMemoRadiSam system protein A n=1 Tax=Candidatus Nitrohelix vancouverensis TaxID=2705534 RepID=A0A7T0C461_9BACT|nr:MAG: AmmeMemoRadiSam system protein A [Candidatus Nitrohelix vancouverensis]
MSPFTRLAYDSIAYYLERQQKLPAPSPPLQSLFTEPRGVFVSLKIKNRLRGCIGSLTPVKDNLWQEIVDNAVKAACKDPRFPPVEQSELDQLTISVDILSPLTPIENLSQTNSREFGLLVRSDKKQGVLLPDLEGVPNVNEQLRICLNKAGIKSGESYKMYQFKVQRYK